MIFNHDVSDLVASIGDVSSLTTTATNLAGAVNELDGNDVAYDSTNKKFTKTKSGITSDVVTAQALREDMGLGNTTGAVPVAAGGTGATTASAARSALGAVAKTTTTTSLASGAMSWTKSVSGVTASNTVICTPAPASYAQWVDNRVRCSGQSSGSLTFTADTNTTAAITVNILILD